MKKDQLITRVLFLKNEGDIFAYFADEIWNNYQPDIKTCYSHIGQHSPCHEDYAKKSQEMTADEYNDLKTELEGMGYNLEILNKDHKPVTETR